MSRHVAHLPLQVSYHDGALMRAELGPEAELTLHIRLNPHWNGGDATVHRVWFTRVRNFEAVAAFFADAVTPAPSGEDLDQVLAIVQEADGIVGVDFARRGYVSIATRKVREL